MAIVTAVVMLCIISISIGYNIAIAEMRKKMIEAERELNNRIGEAMKRASHAEKNYQELQSQLKALASPGVSVDEFNRMWQKISGNMSNR